VAVNYTDIKICNLALAKLGESPITALSENNNRARLLRDLYYLKRDELLRMHPWGFARKRIALAQDSEVPLFDFGAQFLIPSDCLKILKIDCDSRFSREGNKILADSTEMFLFYVFRNEDVDTYDSQFVSLFAEYLAIDLAWSLKGSRTLRADIFREFQNSLALARNSSATESTPLYDMEYEGEGRVMAARAGRSTRITEY